MNNIVEIIERQLSMINLKFTQKPIVIGGMAMEYYDMRKSGVDIDLVVCDADYKVLADLYPEKRKDIYGDLGVVIEPFEIWRSIALLDFGFYKMGAVDEGAVQIVSLDRLLFTRVCAMEVKKYLDDIEIMKEYYYTNLRNKEFLYEAEQHVTSYEKFHGVIMGGRYEDN